MTLYAFDDIDDAFEATRALLWPVDLRRWAKLALVTLFVGGAGGFNPLQFNTGGSVPGGGGGLPGGTGGLPEVPVRVLTIVVAVVAVAVVLGLVFMLVGSVMEFVLVESLSRETVAIRRYWGEWWRSGLRLFGFRLVVGLLTLAVVGGLAALILLPAVLGEGGVSIGLLLVSIPAFAVVAVVGGLVHGFTTVFVVPTMIVEGSGVLAAWRRFWPTMTGQWKQYAAYAVMGFVLQLAAGVVAGVVLVVLGVVLAVPFVLVGIAGLGLLSVSTVAGWLVVGVAVAAYLLVMLVVLALVGVPVEAYLRYYGLLVLGDTDADLDLVADRRAAIRSGDT